MKLHESVVLGEPIAILDNGEEVPPEGLVGYTREDIAHLNALRGKDEDLRRVHEILKVFGGRIERVTTNHDDKEKPCEQ